MEYIEVDVLFDYLLRFHGRLLSPRERAVVRCLDITDKWRGIVADDVSKADEYYALNHPEIAAGQALRDSGEIAVFRAELCARVMRTYRPKINRCKVCARVLRTPNARQCFWCGTKW